MELRLGLDKYGRESRIYLSDKLSALLVENNIQDVCASPLVSENLSVLLAVIRRYVAANHLASISW